MELSHSSLIFLLMILVFVIKAEAHLQQVTSSSQMTGVQTPQFGGQKKDMLGANNFNTGDHVLISRDYNMLPREDLTRLLKLNLLHNTLVSDIKVPFSRKFEGQFLADSQVLPIIRRSSKTSPSQLCFKDLTWPSPYSQSIVRQINLAALSRNGRLSSLHYFRSRFPKDHQISLSIKQLVDGLTSPKNNPEQIEYRKQDDDKSKDCVINFQETGEQKGLENEKRNIRTLVRAGKLPMPWHGKSNWPKRQKDDFVYPLRHFFQLTPLSFFIDKRQPIGYLRFYKVKQSFAKD
ncbi:uncharacterized protein LOC143239043 [Tachypleus tridentatus]|uniref:uncharacterized protein LOC143239043 n=1 Tax=Tachypleus tridentatus TaxID=6853 RepID=UPI003FD309F1